MTVSTGKAFQAEGTKYAKVQRWEHIIFFEENTRPVWLKQRRGGREVRAGAVCSFIYNDNNSITYSSISSITAFGFLDPIPMCVSVWGRVFPHITPSESLTPAGCQRTQLNSDAVCVETAPG